MINPVVPRVVLAIVGLMSLAGLAGRWIGRWRRGQLPSSREERLEVSALGAFGAGIALLALGVLTIWAGLPIPLGAGLVILGGTSLVAALVLRAMSL